MEGIKSIKDSSIDMVVTDPPYGIKYIGKRRKASKQFEMLANDDNDFRFSVYPELARVLKNNAVCIVFASWKNIAFDFLELKKYFDIKNVIVWWKPGGGMGDLKHTLATDYEFAIVCHKGKAPIRGKRNGSVWKYAKVPPIKMVHPTQKPVELLEELICKWSDEGNIVLDPFVGSGTTLVAALNTNRHFIGYEIDAQYYTTACERVKS